MTPSGIITLTTDFGLSDPYVGIMKGVILTILPHAHIVDITHGAGAGAVREGAELLGAAYPYFPRGTVHVGVIDPGVGTDRRPLAVQTEDHWFVGPDNGLLWPFIQAAREPRIFHLTESAYFLPHVSRTFHGRDIFAPVGAHIARGVKPERMGALIRNAQPLSSTNARRVEEGLEGEVVRVDRFGNLISNIPEPALMDILQGRRPKIQAGNMIITQLSETYADAAPDGPLALIGSSGFLEISVNGGRAADRAFPDCESALGALVWVKPLPNTGLRDD